jgi:Uma2 family endonuclease
MATISRKVEYPTGDGKPMAETPVHRDAMIDLIPTLQAYYRDDPMAYVSGNMLVYYEEGNKRRHLAPDVFVVRGIPKHERLNYLVWEEGKGPDLVIELTSKSTRREDQTTKRDLYRDVLRVSEYFLFDPLAEYLDPPLQGFRLVAGEYAPIDPRDGRLPSEVTGLHLESRGRALRLYSPELGLVLPTPAERMAEAEAEVERLRAELESLRRPAED